MLPKSNMYTFGDDYLEIKRRFEEMYFKLAEHLMQMHKVTFVAANELILNARRKFKEFTKKRKGKSFQVLKMSHMKSTFYLHALASRIIFFTEIAVYKSQSNFQSWFLCV